MTAPTILPLDAARYVNTTYVNSAGATRSSYSSLDVEVVVLDETQAIVFVAESREFYFNYDVFVRAYGVTWGVPGYRWAVTVDTGTYFSLGTLTAIKVGPNHAAVYAPNQDYSQPSKWITVSNTDGAVVSVSVTGVGSLNGRVTRNSCIVEGDYIYWGAQPGNTHEILVYRTHAFNGTTTLHASAGTTNLQGNTVGLSDKTHGWAITSYAVWGGGTGFGATGGIGFRYSGYARNPLSRTPPYGIEIAAAGYYDGERSFNLISLDTRLYPYGYADLSSYGQQLDSTSLANLGDQPIVLYSSSSVTLASINANGTPVLFGPGYARSSTGQLNAMALMFNVYDRAGTKPPSRSVYFAKVLEQPARYSQVSFRCSADQGPSRYVAAACGQQAQSSVDGRTFYPVFVAYGNLSDFGGGAPTSPLRHRQNGIN